MSSLENFCLLSQNKPKHPGILSSKSFACAKETLYPQPSDELIPIPAFSVKIKRRQSADIKKTSMRSSTSICFNEVFTINKRKSSESFIKVPSILQRPPHKATDLSSSHSKENNFSYRPPTNPRPLGRLIKGRVFSSYYKLKQSNNL